MRYSSFLWGIWPGLSGLVQYGRWVFLAIAAGFGIIFSSVLFACFFWTEWIAFGAKPWILASLALCWGIFTLISRSVSEFFAYQNGFDSRGDRYLRALDYYLAGKWVETEKILKAILRKNGRDSDSLLFLATLRRHTDRPAEAAELLDQIARLEEGEKWRDEVRQERTELAAMEKSTEDCEEDDDDSAAILKFPSEAA